MSKLSDIQQDSIQIKISSGSDKILFDEEIDTNKLSSSNRFFTIQTEYEDSLKILNFATLEEGWHFGEGLPIETEIIQKALKLDKEAYECGYFETDAFPGINGEVVFTICYEDDYFEFIIENNGLITYVHEFKDEEILCESNMLFNNALEKIKHLKDEICSLSEYYITGIGIQKKEDLSRWHFKIFETVSPPYQKNVLFKEGEKFADILNSFTQKSPEYLLFFGDSQYKTYHTII